MAFWDDSCDQAYLAFLRSICAALFYLAQECSCLYVLRLLMYLFFVLFHGWRLKQWLLRVDGYIIAIMYYLERHGVVCIT